MEALTCRLLPWEVGDGPTNMAADETLVRAAADSGIASLRFYGWSPPTLSLGYFQPADAHLAGLPFVRRPSGGAAIVHHHELTYALAVPPGPIWHQGGPWMARMHRIIAAALAGFGLAESVSAVPVGEEIKRDDVLCFHHLTAGDLICMHKKVVGSAQRKYRRALVQHGSILLATSEYAPDLPGLVDLTNVAVDAGELCQAIARAFTTETGWTLHGNAWALAERKLIAELVRDKYASPVWNERR